MHNLTLNKKKFRGPSGWHELDAKGLLQLATYTRSKNYARLTSYFLIVSLFRIPKSLFLKLNNPQRLQLLPLVQWVYSENRIEKWLLKRFTIGGKKYYGPADRLNDLTIAEFMYTEAAYERYLYTENLEYLDMLAAVLYRPRSFWGIRKPFNKAHFAARTKLMGKMAPYIRTAVGINYAGCRNFIISKHPAIWQKSDDVTDQPATRQAKHTNWADFILELAGDKFGTYEQTTKTDLWVFLSDLNKKAARAAAAKPQPKENDGN